MRLIGLTALLLATPALAAPANDQWHAKAREMLDKAIAYPTVAGRNQVPAYAQYLADQYKAAGFGDIRIVPYEGVKGDNTAALIVRWPAEGKAAKKPILILSHMDVVEAKASDWSLDPFKMVEKDGYYYGRGTTDIKSGNVAVTTALLKLKASGFKPKPARSFSIRSWPYASSATGSVDAYTALCALMYCGAVTFGPPCASVLKPSRMWRRTRLCTKSCA